MYTTCIIEGILLEIRHSLENNKAVQLSKTLGPGVDAGIATPTYFLREGKPVGARDDSDSRYVINLSANRCRSCDVRGCASVSRANANIVTVGFIASGRRCS